MLEQASKWERKEWRSERTLSVSVGRVVININYCSLFAEKKKKIDSEDTQHFLNLSMGTCCGYVNQKNHDSVIYTGVGPTEKTVHSGHAQRRREKEIQEVLEKLQ